jgi:hypothetical protein
VSINVIVKVEDDEVIFVSPTGAPVIYTGSGLMLTGSVEAFKKLRDAASEVVAANSAPATVTHLRTVGAD